MGNIMGRYVHISAQVEGKKVGPGSLGADLDMAMNDRNVGDMVTLWNALNERERRNLVEGFVKAGRGHQLELLFRLAQEDTSRRFRGLNWKVVEMSATIAASYGETIALVDRLDRKERELAKLDAAAELLQSEAEIEVRGLKEELAQAKDRVTRWRADYIKLEAELATVRDALAHIADMVDGPLTAESSD